MYDIIIIGGGPAGISAAIYAARAKRKTVLIASEFGGWITRENIEIENYPGLGKITGKNLVGRFKDHLESLPVETKMAEVFDLKNADGLFQVAAAGEKITGRAVVVATGASPRLAGIAGEKEFLGKGVCYCATCDGPLFARRNVAVVGGGNAAFEAAIFLAKFANKIYVLERQPRVSADRANQDALAATGKAEVILNAAPLRIEGDGFVKKIIYRNVGDAAEKETELAVEGVFIKAGNRPAADFLAGLADLNEKGEIKIDLENNQTKTPGLFAAGDVSQIGYKQVIVAAAEGAKAAMAADNYLRRSKA